MTRFDELAAGIRSLADLDRIAVTDARGYLRLRLGIVVTLFFADGYRPEKRAAFAAVMRDYYETFADHVTYAVSSRGGSPRRITGVAFLDEWDRDARRSFVDGDPDDAELNAFTPHLIGPPEGEDKSSPPLYYCGGTSLPADAWFPPTTLSYLNAHLPASFGVERGWDALTDLVRRWCLLLEPLHGTAGLGTLFNQSRLRTASGPVAFPLIKRFPGLDYNDSGAWRAKMRDVDWSDPAAGGIRTTNWLTILGDRFVERLGGAARLAEKLGAKCPVHSFAGGVVVQAGAEPQLGDLDRGTVPATYCTVARVLKPVRFEDYKRGVLEPPHPLDPLDETLKWLRRFD